jgi:uncharacterized membrane protein
MKERSTMWLAALAASIFIVLAVAGGFVTVRHMNATADIHNMSAGRSGDAQPDRINEQDAASAPRPSTTGADTNVPPAHR